jgi:hypothetical protein
LKFASELGCALALALTPGVVAAQSTATSERAASPVRVVGRTFIEPSIAPPAPHALDAIASFTLTAVLLRETRWSEAAVGDAIAQAAVIIGQCGVRLDRFELIQVDVAPRLRYLDHRASRELAAAVAPRRPAAFFVEDTRNRPAFDAEAFGRGNTRTRPELTDSVWLTADVRDAGVALAHELVHVLTNSGAHVIQPNNLMQEAITAASLVLTPDQCDRIARVGIDAELLEQSRRSK